MIPAFLALQALSSPRKIVYGAIALLAGAAIAYHAVRVYSLQADVAQARGATAEVEGRLQRRIAVEAAAVTAAVQRARDEERAARAQLQKDHDELKQARAADGAALPGMRQRLYDTAARRPACASGGRLPAPAVAAGGADTPAGGELPAADRKLIDELLQLGAEANEVARQRNLAVKMYRDHCAKD